MGRGLDPAGILRSTFSSHRLVLEQGAQARDGFLAHKRGPGGQLDEESMSAQIAGDSACQRVASRPRVTQVNAKSR